MAATKMFDWAGIVNYAKRFDAAATARLNIPPCISSFLTKRRNPALPIKPLLYSSPLGVPRN